MAREKDQPPGVPVGAQFGDFFNSTPVLNDRGEVAFSFTMQNDPFLVVNSTNNTGVWFGTPGALVLVAREGSQAAALPANVVYETLDLYDVVINNASQLAFKGNLRQGLGGVDSTSDTALWAGSSNNLTLVAREGSQVPGLPTGATFGGLDEPLLSDFGQVAFRADLNIGAGGVTSANNTIVMTGGFSNLLVAVREGWDGSADRPGFCSMCFRTCNCAAQPRVALRRVAEGGDPAESSAPTTRAFGSAPPEKPTRWRAKAQPPGEWSARSTAASSGWSPTSTEACCSAETSFTGAGGVTLNNDGGLWLAASNGISLVAREGLPAANTPAGVSYGLL